MNTLNENVRVEYVANAYGGITMHVWNGNKLIDREEREPYQMYLVPTEVLEAFGVQQ